MFNSNKRGGFSKLLLLTPLLIVSACSSLSSQLDCPAPSPLKRCQSLLEVDAEFDKKSQVKPTLASTQKTPVSTWGSPSSRLSSPTINPLLTTANRVQRVWVAPFVDEANNYHSASHVYTLIDAGTWVTEPLATISK